MADLLDKGEDCPSSPKKERSMTMVIFFHASVESCGGGHRMSSKERGGLLWPFLRRRKRDHGTFLLSSVKSCEGGHGLCHHFLEKRGSCLLVLRGRG